MATIERRQSAMVFKAIADPTRRRILGLLAEGRQSVGELAQNFHTSRPAISKHLRVLRGAGLVVARKQGTSSICELDARPLRAVNAWLRDYEKLWDESLNNLRKYMEDQR